MWSEGWGRSKASWTGVGEQLGAGARCRWALLVVLAPLLSHASPGAVSPPRLLADSPAQYPPALSQKGVAGTVELDLLIDGHGDVEEVRVLSSLDPALHHAALHAAVGLRFEPATVEGEPVPVWIRFHYRFEAPLPVVPRTELRGRVRAKGTREPIAGATVLIDGQPVEVGPEGLFAASVTPGVLRVAVHATGFERGAFVETLGTGETLEVDYRLEPTFVNPYQTVVRGVRDRTEISRISLRAQELRDVPGTMGDPFRVVMALPGVASIINGLAYPVVRGSQPASTGFFLDGVQVPILFHLFLGPSVVHPDFIDGIDFYAGATPPQFGRLMGGAVSARTTRVRKEGLRASAYADLLNAGLFTEGRVAATGTGVSLAGRVSYSPWLIAETTRLLQPDRDERVVLDFFDYQGRLEQPIGDGNLRLFAFGSSDVASTFVGNDTHGVMFHRVDVRMQQPVQHGDLELGATWGFERIEHNDQLEEGGETIFSLDTMTLGARGRWTRELGARWTLAVGGDIENRGARKRKRVVLPPRDLTSTTYLGPPGVGIPVGFSVQPTVPELPPAGPLASGTFSGGYAQLTWRPRDAWVIVPALRVDNYHLVPGVDLLALEPRLMVRHQLTPSLALKGGSGLVHQPPTTLLSLPVLDITGLKDGLQQGLLSSVGLEWTNEWFDLQGEVYFNRLFRTVEMNPFNEDAFASLQVPDKVARKVPDGPNGDGASDGYAYGLEMMIRRSIGKRWFGWISYTLSRSTRLIQFDRHDAEGNVVGTATKYLPYALDQTHVLNAVLSLRLGKGWTLGTSAHFHSGRPETGGLTSETLRPGLDPSGGERWVPADRDQSSRLPNYFRLDARVANAMAFDNFTLEVYLDLFNLSLNQEVVRYVYGQREDDASLVRIAEGALIAFPVLGVKGTY